METVIKKLSEIEIAAKKIMEDAHGQLDVLKDKMHEKAAIFDAEVKKDTDKKLDALRKELQAKTDDALAKLKTDTVANLNSLNNYYEKHHNKISETIFKKIIGA